MPRLFRIAIDGPAASGKSTTAKQLARILGFKYIDSGALYRSVTLKTVEKGLDPVSQPQQVAELAASLDIQFPEFGKVSIHGQDVTSQLRQESVARAIAPIASNPAVRHTLAEQQRRMGRTLDTRYPGFAWRGETVQGCVMDGRDTGTVIWPDAELKIFLVADIQARAERRFKEVGDKTINTLEAIMKDIEARDHADRTRAVGPLKKADDAIELDTSHLTIAQQVEKIHELVRARLD
ncbi:cytidylate kinase [Gongronella butleri]|nr:cytidylate kinase [Gongronella butleri]